MMESPGGAAQTTRVYRNDSYQNTASAVPRGAEKIGLLRAPGFIVGWVTIGQHKNASVRPFTAPMNFLRLHELASRTGQPFQDKCNRSSSPIPRRSPSGSSFLLDSLGEIALIS